MLHAYRRLNVLHNSISKSEVLGMCTFNVAQRDTMLLQYVNILRALRYITSVYTDDPLFSHSGVDTLTNISANELALRISFLNWNEAQRRLYNQAIDVPEYERTSSGNVGIIMVRNTFTNSFLTVLVHNQIIYRISAGRFLFLRKFRKRRSVVVRFGKLIRAHLARWSREYGVVNWKFVLAGYRRFAWTFFSTIRRMKTRMSKTHRYYKRRFKLTFTGVSAFYQRILLFSNIRYCDGWRRRQYARTTYGKIRRILRKRRINFGIFGVHAQRLLYIGKQVERLVAPVITCIFLYDDYRSYGMPFSVSRMLTGYVVPCTCKYTYVHRLVRYIYYTLYVRAPCMYFFFTYTALCSHFDAGGLPQSYMYAPSTCVDYLYLLPSSQRCVSVLKRLRSTSLLVSLCKQVRQWLRILSVRTRKYYFSRYRRVMITEEMLRFLATYFRSISFSVKGLVGFRSVQMTLRNLMRWWYRRAYRRFFIRSLLRYYNKQVLYTLTYYVRSVRKPFNGIRKVQLLTKRNPRGIWR